MMDDGERQTEIEEKGSGHGLNGLKSLRSYRLLNKADVKNCKKLVYNHRSVKLNPEVS